jgi:hypothetical protein
MRRSVLGIDDDGVALDCFGTIWDVPQQMCTEQQRARAYPRNAEGEPHLVPLAL